MQGNRKRAGRGRFGALALVVTAGVLSACQISKPDFEIGSGPDLVRQAEARALSENALKAEYRLGPGDKLNVVVFGQQDLSGEFEIDGSGNMSLPLIGQFKAGGLTLAQVTESLRETLDEQFVVDPRLSLEVTNYRPFYILGEVNRPGRYDYVNGLTARQAVAIAGGFTRRGRTTDVVLVRDGEAGPAFTFIDLDAPVLPGDTVQIERRMF